MGISKVLIANRGEIAVRIISACHQLGMEAVAVHSTADSKQPHVNLADEAYCIGPDDPQESYLSFPAIMSAADISGADAVHPGYGFLSENSRFAEVCEDHGLKFIGPNSALLRKSGNKIQAKHLAEEAGVNVLPGSRHSITEKEEILTEAREIGFPVIIKAALGGGGRGMRIVQNEEELIPAFQASQQEAKASFDEEALYLEKFLQDPKHVEVQLMADEQGNVTHVGERDCSIQRRHQKLIEESPAPSLDSDTRKSIHSDALKIARHFDYRSLGTAEFMVDSHNNHFFIELNARVQVEHPVTEEVYRFNMIKEQLEMAGGKSLQQDRFQPSTDHAIEFRINAEDPFRDFLPSSGILDLKQLPGGNGVRFDTWIKDGLEMVPQYDSLIGKLIIRADNRDSAFASALSALRQLEIEGVKTTRDLHLDLLAEPEFVSGEYTIHFLENYLAFTEPSKVS